MTPEEKIIQDLKRDLLFVMMNPSRCCWVCKYRDRDCEKTGCTPVWRGQKENGG